MLPSEGNLGAAGLGLNQPNQQLVMKRVESVILDDSHEHYNNYTDIGRIFFTVPNTNYYDQYASFIPKVTLNPNHTALPISPQNIYFPVRGEIVFVVVGLSSRTPQGRGRKGIPTDKYYFPPIRAQKAAHHNSILTRAEGGIGGIGKRGKAETGTPTTEGAGQSDVLNVFDYSLEKEIAPLLPYEGDNILEGRYGNSIRLGSTTYYDSSKEKGPRPNPWSINSAQGISTVDEIEGETGDPIIIIRNGQTETVSDNALAPLLEDINGDHSSIYLCSNQQLSTLQVAGVSVASPGKVDQGSYLETEGEDGGLEPLMGKDMFLSDETIKFNIEKSIVERAQDISGNFGDYNAGNTGTIMPAKVTVLEQILNGGKITSESAGFLDDDGLSFYNEMVVNSEVANPDDFITYEYAYENEIIGGAELDPSEIIAQTALLNTQQSGDYGTGYLPLEEFMPPSYPVEIPYRQNGAVSTIVHKPIAMGAMASRILAEPKAGRVKHLCLHTTAGEFTQVGLAHFFLQRKSDTGWSAHGYHISVGRDGTSVKNLEDSKRSNGIGMADYSGNETHLTSDPVNNGDTINISWIGGASGMDMTREQAATFKKLVKTYIRKYPNITIMGHNQVKHKACPWFWVPTYLRELGIAEKNIWQPEFKSGKSSSGATLDFSVFHENYNKAPYTSDAVLAAKITGLKSGA